MYFITIKQGDNDPLDVVEIGSKVIPIGSVVPVNSLLNII
jgi:inorganic pyrophosphatase